MNERIPTIYLPAAVQRYKDELESEEVHEPPPQPALGWLWLTLVALVAATLLLWKIAGGTV